MTSETKTMFHSEDMGVFNRPLAVSIKYDGLTGLPNTCFIWGVRGTSAKFGPYTGNMKFST